MDSNIEERSYQFSRSIVIFTQVLWKTAEGRIIAQQLIRSATSIGANIAEGQDASSKRQFLQYLQIALRSSRETQFWLRLLAESIRTSDTNLARLRTENDQIIRILVSSVIRLKGIQNSR